ncbi:MAG: A24 family peptidase [Nanoarchaeota archaeon]|nr:A24 family peptidase [Nanoarchaeota archaeon]MBU0962563.1 A24 family peptidase [Nanoarchaeota archaeon]
MIDYFLILIALVYLIIATIFDIKTKEVPDWLSFSLIAIALFSNLLYSLVSSEFNYIIYSLSGLLISFLFGSLMYYSRQWGGGDTKLLIGLCTLLPRYPEKLLSYFNPNLNLPFLFILLLNILIIGGLYGLFMSILLAIKNRNKFIKEFSSLFRKYKSSLFLVLIINIILIIVSYFLGIFIIMLPLFLLVWIIILSYIFIKSVENSSMYKMFDVNKLVEGDWVVGNVKSKNKIIYKQKLLGVTEKDINILKKYRIKKVLVKDGLPFVPAFLIGFVITLIYGNLFLVFIF